MVRGGSPDGPRRSEGGFGREKTAEIISDTGRMKNTSINVCTKTVFVG
jgi:hypothetical protein